jgi:hypothetical protein
VKLTYNVNLASILTHIRSMRDRKGLSSIIRAAENRDGHLLNIEIGKERTKAWRKFNHLVKNDMVFIHVKPEGIHRNLWAQPLTIKEIRPRNKEVVVRSPTGRADHKLSVLTCERLKLSKVPTPEALANGLRGSTK